MTKLTAIVDGDIPAHRVLNVYNKESGDVLLVGLPKHHGGYVDFITSVDLKSGQIITINMKNNPVWNIKTSTKVRKGQLVASTTDGRVGVYDDAQVFVGYALDTADEGQVVRVMRSPQVNLNISATPASEIENEEPATIPSVEADKVTDDHEEAHSVDLADMTVRELREIAKELNITGYSNMKKDELLEVLKAG